MNRKTEQNVNTLFHCAAEGEKAFRLKWFENAKLVLLLVNIGLLYALKIIPDKVPSMILSFVLIWDQIAFWTTIFIAIFWKRLTKKAGKGCDQLLIQIITEKEDEKNRG